MVDRLSRRRDRIENRQVLRRSVAYSQQQRTNHSPYSDARSPWQCRCRSVPHSTYGFAASAAIGCAAKLRWVCDLCPSLKHKRRLFAYASGSDKLKFASSGSILRQAVVSGARRYNGRSTVQISIRSDSHEACSSRPAVGSAHLRRLLFTAAGGGERGGALERFFQSISGRVLSPSAAGSDAPG